MNERESMKIKNKKESETIMKNQLIELLIKHANLSKDNYDCFENIKITLNDDYSIVLSEQDLKNYFDASAGMLSIQKEER